MRDQVVAVSAEPIKPKARSTLGNLPTFARPFFAPQALNLFDLFLLTCVSSSLASETILGVYPAVKIKDVVPRRPRARRRG